MLRFRTFAQHGRRVSSAAVGLSSTTTSATPPCLSSGLDCYRLTLALTSRCLSTTSCVHNLSYRQADPALPLLGKTIGQIVDDTTEKFPDREYVVFSRDKVRRTFSQFREECDRLAAGLLATGVGRDDCVGIWGPSTLEWVLTQFATARIGAILVNINPAYRQDELEYALKKVGVKTIVSAQSFKTQNYYEMLNGICPEMTTATPGNIKSENLPMLKSVVMMGKGNFPGTFSFDDVMDMGKEDHFKHIEKMKSVLQFDQPVNIQFTSGTTGKPKGATLTHHNIVNNSYFIGAVLKYHEQEHRIGVPVPLYHCFGMVGGSLCAMVHGNTCVFPSPSFEPEASLKGIQEERITSQYGTPTMFIDMLNHPNFNQYDMSSLTTGIMAGSPCPIETMKQTRSLMNMKDVCIAYGLTEVSPVICQTEMHDPVDLRVSTVGKPSPHNEIKIIDPQSGELVPYNTPGELCSRGYTTMVGYWKDEVKTKEAIDQTGWFHSGDIATMNEEGYITMAGRIKDLVIRGGENIYPTEIEQFLYKHPKIEDVQVIGVPDERMGEELCAWIRLKAGQEATPEEIKSFCKGKISHFKIPRYIEFVDEFPLTVTGKVQKFKMRQVMEEKMKK
ncbi:medium-chain acyl-CoA ligase ACSF2, mitochondrial-like [Strongylocentrotus purpuratus]|uniref:Medium-chain acyl-CoA ligase ACSF2, mitochondrial n=1 Tax=Strongylocentrotus purpuratus TaxID=7668 RepID=A0A7M7NGY3_STRPU|nr:medium-chain acyl-CoA ligase ACSF2, mitochondrial-like [Strongylocentrotus purpuratus]